MQLPYNLSTILYPALRAICHYLTTIYFHFRNFNPPFSDLYWQPRRAAHRHRHDNHRIVYVSFKQVRTDQRSISEDYHQRLINVDFLPKKGDRSLFAIWTIVCHRTRSPAALLTWREIRWGCEYIFRTVMHSVTIQLVLLNNECDFTLEIHL